jgi:hypothetical protein
LFIFREIAERYRGTQVGYEALDFLVNNTDDDQTLVYLQQIISDFPDTLYETEARADLLAFHFDRNYDKQAFLQGCADIAQELGGPSLNQIIDSPNSLELSNQIRDLGEDKQRRLLKVYQYMYGMVGRKFDQIPGDVADHEAKMRALYFLHRTFTPLSIGYDGIRPIYRSLPTDTRNLLPDHPVFRDPSVTFESPTQGSTTEPQPLIAAKLEGGDFTTQAISLNEIKATLDGQDVKGKLMYQTTFGEPATGKPFLTIDLSFRPATPLSPGPHQFMLEVPVEKYPGEGPGKSIKAVDFIVQAENTQTPVKLSSIRDTILSQREQHQNEGINFLLTLEKIQGKAARSAIAFNLDNTNLIGLSKATLILSVNPSEQVNGWGNGRTISVQALNSSWQEGNGKSFGLQKKDQIAGNGAGATWFSPSDEDISNDSANSAISWNGATYSAAPPTAPSVGISNGSSGEVAFDVTADVLNGAKHGWLILKDQENVGSKVSFYSKEGAAAAGNPDLGPRLLLEFGQVASNSSGAQSETLLSRIGFGAIGTKLRPISGSEVRSVKQFLQENKVAALAVEQLVSQATLTNPVANWTTRLAYRSWVSESIQIAANLEMTRS